MQSSLLSSFTCILLSSNLRACIRTLREHMALMGERERDKKENWKDVEREFWNLEHL